MSVNEEEVISLFMEVTDHLVDNIDDENIPLLSSIAKATDPTFSVYDFDSVDNALCLIHKYFSGAESKMDRFSIFATFGRRLAVKNVMQLTENYNRIINNVRRFFPEFNLAHASHNHVFGSQAIASCFVRKCSDQDLDAFARQRSLQYKNPDRVISKIKTELNKKYNGDYSDGVALNARSLDDPFNVFSTGLKHMFDYGVYTGKGYAAVNTLLRSIKTSDMTLISMVQSFNSFAQNLLLPFYSQEDFSIYRGDTISVSSDSFVTKGFYSGGLSVLDIGYFAKNGGRIIKINIVKGTPFIPIVLKRVQEGEVVLLPGTALRKDTDMKLHNGHYAEYTVVQNPPKLSDIEEATIFKHAIPDKFKDAVDHIKMFKQNGEEWSRGLKDPEGVASLDETLPFVVNLINSRYGGDW